MLGERDSGPRCGSSSDSGSATSGYAFFRTVLKCYDDLKPEELELVVVSTDAATGLPRASARYVPVIAPDGLVSLALEPAPTPPMPPVPPTERPITGFLPLKLGGLLSLPAAPRYAPGSRPCHRPRLSASCRTLAARPPAPEAPPIRRTPAACSTPGRAASAASGR